MKDKIKKWCLLHHVEVQRKPIPYGEKWILTRFSDNIHLNFYDSGKWTIQGKDSSLKKDIESLFLLPQEPSLDFKGTIIGSDESGKGDYFGPLVVASFYYEEAMKADLLKLGVKDSKKLSEKKIREIAKELRSMEHSLIVLSPMEYNFIYEETKNLNQLLAKLHSECVHSLLARHSADHVIIDQFASDAAIIKSHFRDTNANIVTRFRAEEITAVACASIIARSVFVEEIASQEKNYQQNFPKGASLEVEMAAEHFVKKHGLKNLGEVAKLHFVTTQKILQLKL